MALTCWKLLVVLLIMLLQQNGGLNHELDEKEPGPGHLEPLGLQRPSEGKIDVVDEFPEPAEFYKKYVLPGKPLLIKNGAKNIPAFTLWNDAYLAEKYGSETIEVEVGKKEKRQGAGKQVRFDTFLKIYNQSDIYMVQDAKDVMRADLGIPRSLQCGGFQNNMLQAVLWFSSGGTKSVLHNDQPDNMNCILDGNKDIIFMDKVYRDDVEADGWREDGGYSSMDVESVDLNKFPRFRHVPWLSARMIKGDCLFIPSRWYHSVKSSESRNFAANLWFTHLMWFNQTDCEHHPPKKELVSLENVVMYGLESIEMLRLEMFEHASGKEVVNMEDVTPVWGKFLTPDDVQQVFGLVDQNHDMVLTWEEIYSMNVLEVIRTFPDLVDYVDDYLDAYQGNEHDEL